MPNTSEFYAKLRRRIQLLNTYLCIGLDPDPKLMPDTYSKTPEGCLQFLSDMIRITANHCIAYKPNLAFFEAWGIEGLHILVKLRKRIPADIPVIIDAKRGDIGPTSRMQAKFIFDHLGADATTLHPYMGEDSLTPFFEYKNAHHFVLCLTSNPGAKEFEKQRLVTGIPLYEAVTQKCGEWLTAFGNVGCVVGGTQAELPLIRKLHPDLLFLIPGVGAQGGHYTQTAQDGLNQDKAVLINASRAVLYPAISSGPFEKRVLSAIRKLTEH